MRLARPLSLVLVLLALPSVAASQSGEPDPGNYGRNDRCTSFTDKTTCLGGCAPTSIFNDSCDCWWDAPPSADPRGFPTDDASSCPVGAFCCWNIPCSRWSESVDCELGSGGVPDPEHGNEVRGANCEIGPSGCACKPPLVAPVLPTPVPNDTAQAFASFDCLCPHMTRERWLAQGATGECKPQLEHFALYKVKTTSETTKFAAFGPVILTDQFATAVSYRVMKPSQLGLPADKNAGGVFDQATHLEEYQVKRAPGAPKFESRSNVAVVNQCSNVYLEVTKPVSLLVPTAKSESAPVTPPDPGSSYVDHLLCYKAKLQTKLADGTKLPEFPKGIQVDVTDQFQTRRYDLTGITKLCTPVDKSGAPVLLSGANKGSPKPIASATRRNPDQDLVCYKAKLAKSRIEQLLCGAATAGDKGTKIVPKQEPHTKRSGLFVANQFGAERLDTAGETELCIPSATTID